MYHVDFTGLKLYFRVQHYGNYWRSILWMLKCFTSSWMWLYHCYYSSGLGPGQLGQPAVETVLSLSTCRIIKHMICMLQVILNEKKCTRLKDNIWWKCHFEYVILFCRQCWGRKQIPIVFCFKIKSLVCWRHLLV